MQQGLDDESPKMQPQVLPASPAVLIGIVCVGTFAILDARDALDNTLCWLHSRHGKRRSDTW
jgi:hypothetical protein